MTGQRTLQDREEALSRASDKICRTMAGYFAPVQPQSLLYI